MPVESSQSSLSRRSLVSAAGAALAMPVLGRASASPVPAGVLTGAAARQVDPRQFVGAATLHRWQERIDDLGLRPTGGTVQHRYIQRLAERFERAGVRQLREDQVPFRQWLAKDGYGLDVLGGTGAGKVRVAGYVPYSGSTGPRGVTGALTTEPTAGAIGLATATASSLPYVLFDGIDYDAPLQPTHPLTYNPTEGYQRSWPASMIDPEASQERW